MLDRELLALAALAAGYTFEWGAQPLILAIPPDAERPWRYWNPLDDDGDALRLANLLQIHVLRYENMTTAKPLYADWVCDERDADHADVDATTRRAIVRAAAEIAKRRGFTL
jgi:hypothetical protein